jgi:hypothetical protein
MNNNEPHPLLPSITFTYALSIYHVLPSKLSIASHALCSIICGSLPGLSVGRSLAADWLRSPDTMHPRVLVYLIAEDVCNNTKPMRAVVMTNAHDVRRG